MDMYFLLKSYKEQLKVVTAYRETLQRGTLPNDPAEAFLVDVDSKHKRITELEEDKSEHEICGGIISDLEYTIEWIETGRRPGAKRDIDRRSVYSLRTILIHQC